MPLYKYPDGSTGSTPYQLGADGQYMRQGSGLVEGTWQSGQPGSGYTAAQMSSIMGGPAAPNAFANSGFGQPTQPSFGGTVPGAGNGSGDGFTVSNGQTPGSSVGGGQQGGTPYYAQSTNPYLQQQGNAMLKQLTDNFKTNVMPGISSQAVASGGYGGSRQGVIEANAMNDLNAQGGSALANLYGNAFGQQLQYDLGRRNNDLGNLQANQNYNLGMGNLGLGYYNAGNNYNLGQGNLGLGYANLDRNINNDNNQWALQGANLSNSVWNQLMGNNQTGISAGTNIQNNPLNYLNQFGNLFNGIGSGFGTSTGTTNVNGNPLLGALGGAQLGGQIGNLWGGGLKSGGGGIMDQLGGLGVF
ncbi:hypothetical protein [Delftia sp. PE138]|uniref:hypothetical protein n=1 Tax=Delftia sp. PE138 TaxID=1812483 RepID=UPI001BAF45EC|nr:hypothetical protein [Delftia sp. PE138]